MGFIKEPEGVDFIIRSKPLSDKERKEINLYIKDYKSKTASQKSQKVVRSDNPFPIDRNKRGN